jgi:hypothetical protein
MMPDRAWDPSMIAWDSSSPAPSPVVRGSLAIMFTPHRGLQDFSHHTTHICLGGPYKQGQMDKSVRFMQNEISGDLVGQRNLLMGGFVLGTF